MNGLFLTSPELAEKEYFSQNCLVRALRVSAVSSPALGVRLYPRLIHDLIELLASDLPIIEVNSL